MPEYVIKIFKQLCSATIDIVLFSLGFVFCIASLGAIVMSNYSAAGALGVGGLLMCVFGSRKLWLSSWRKKRQEQQKLANISRSTLSETASAPRISDFAQESFDKAVADYNAINDIIRHLKDNELIEQLKKMQAIAHKMIGYLQEHPEKLSLADQFINYYQDRALSLSRQFQEFEEMNLNSKDVARLKAKIKITLSSFDEAYEAQFTRMVSDKILELESELQVARQIMSDAGIHNIPEATNQPKANTTSPHQIENNKPEDFRIERPFEVPEQETSRSNRPRGRFQH